MTTLNDTLSSTCRSLATSLDDIGAPTSRLSARGQALAVVDLMRQVLAQAPVEATGADFIAAAQWLAGWYAEQHSVVSQLASSPILLDASGESASSVPQHVVEGMARGAAMWGEVVALDGVADPATATYHGVLCIWTGVVAALCGMLYGSGARSRQEAVALAMMLGQLSREAAAMAQGMVGEEVAESADTPMSNQCDDEASL